MSPAPPRVPPDRTPREERLDITDHWDCADSSDAVLNHDPIENTERAEPIDPIDRAEPMDPMDSTDPTEPIDSNESCDHRDSTEPEDA
ncbi:hypothetical protein [Sinomonas mesophila]|uniref:hypothetical protein n=1 Tax=Sinomonas mesophila TaxID=1531955 RepID=UPI00158CD0CF|nr:hypothetical protein [Sinomonas mesophila]